MTIAALGIVTSTFFLTHALGAGFVQGLTGTPFNSPATPGFFALLLAAAVLLLARSSGVLKQPAFALLR